MLAHPVCIIGQGQVSALGANADLALAASAVGLSRVQLCPLELGDDEVVDVTVARLESGVEGEAASLLGRMILLVSECLAGIDGRNIQGPAPIRAWLALPAPCSWLPENAPTILTNVLSEAAAPLRIGSTVTLRMDHAGGLMGIALAATAIANDEVEFALVGAVDSQVDTQTLKALHDEQRLLRDGVPGGLVPGEAAACVLLCSPRVQKHLKLPSLGCVVGVGLADEANPVGSQLPCVGRGLTTAVRDAIASLPAPARVTDLYVDLNGERHRTDDWAFTVPRINNRLEDPSRLFSPTVAHGDLGAATGPGLLLSAIAMAAQGQAHGDWSLIWACARGKERAALLVETPPMQSRRGTPCARPPRLPAIAATEKGLAAEMIDEVAAWWHRRHGLLRDLEVADACDWHSVASLEGRMVHALVGLRTALKDVAELTAAGLKEQDPATLYVWAATNLPSATATLAQLAGQNPRLDLAILEAAEHISSATEIPALVTSWLARPDPLGDIAVCLASRHGIPVARDRAQVAVARLGAAAPVLGAQLLSRLGNPNDGIRLQSWLVRAVAEDAEPIAAAWVHLSGEVALAELRRNTAPWAATAALSGAVGNLAARAQEFQESRAYCYALAMAGEPSGLPVLLGRLGGHPDALAAARALDLITGAALRDEVGALTLSRASWETWIKANGARFSNGKRFRLGQLRDSAATLAALKRTTFPPSLRRCLVREWEREQGRPLMDVDRLVVQQERALSEASRALLSR
jgi:3-oxoacyl-[acyl-carrier-protein] synthase-1